ncbi:MAG: hypothetical protein HY043_13200 [Verrucomicrobia bacterium]|nr:hypothetical protein [Verrucomicrobiota bacterium]
MSLAQERNGRNEWEASVVTVDVTRKQYDYQQPWSTRQRTVQKSGIVIGEKEVLTTAEDLSDRTLVRIQKFGRGKWSNAEVKWIDYHANLAILSADDTALWTGLKPATLAHPIVTKAPMQVVRWRNGKFETRKAEFTQFVVNDAKLSFIDYLQFEVSSEINGGGWAEPIISGDKLAGLTTSQTGNTCTVIPASFIYSVLEARRQGTYAGLGYFAFTWQPAENQASLKFLKLDGEPRGVIVSEVPRTPGLESPLKPRDIILQVDGFDIDIQGDYDDPDYGSLSLENLATRNRWAGNDVKLKIWRDGQAQDIVYRLPKADYASRFLPDQIVDQEPEYLIVGGLVFQPLSVPFLRSWGDDWKRRSPFRLFYYSSEEPTKERPALVLLSLVLPDAYNLGYQDTRYLVLDKVNGRKVSRLPELREALRYAEGGYHVIELTRGEGLQRIVLDASETESATQRILKRYGIVKDRFFASETSGAR